MNKTQKEKVLNYIQKKGYITTLDAMIDLCVCDLQSNIRDLKNDGIKIKSEWVTNRNTKSSYKVYALKQEKIDRYKRMYA